MARMGKGSPRIQFEQSSHESSSHLNQTNNLRLLKSKSLAQQLDLNKIMDDACSPSFNFTRSSTFRQNQQLSFIKSKFLRMIELQNKNVVEKNELEKERESILREEALKAKSQANRIKDERSHSGVTSRNWKVKNMQEGAIVRSRKLQNQFLIARRELQDLNSKKHMVNDFHKTSLIFAGKDGDPLRKKMSFYEYLRSTPRQVTQLKVNPKSITRILNEKKVVMIHESNDNWRGNYEQ